MFTTSMFGIAAVVHDRPLPVCIIWRQEKRVGWDFFTRAPADEVEMILWKDSVLKNLDRTHYRVTQG